jgi:hypothetical protein
VAPPAPVQKPVSGRRPGTHPPKAEASMAPDPLQNQELVAPDQHGLEADFVQ